MPEAQSLVRLLRHQQLPMLFSSYALSNNPRWGTTTLGHKHHQVNLTRSVRQFTSSAGFCATGPEQNTPFSDNAVTRFASSGISGPCSLCALTLRKGRRRQEHVGHVIDQPEANEGNARRMRRVLAWILPILLLAGLAAIALFWAAPDIEDDISAQARTVLDEAGYTGVTTEVDGRNVRLIGLPNDTDESRAIAQLVNDQVDGVRQVIVPRAAPATPQSEPGANSAELTVTIEDDVTVTGTLANNGQMDRVTEKMNELFGPGTIVDLRTNPNFDDAVVDRMLLLVEPVLDAAANDGLVQGVVSISRKNDDSPGAFNLTVEGTARNEFAEQAIVDAADSSLVPGGVDLDIAESVSPVFRGEELEPELLKIKLLEVRYERSELALTDDQREQLADLVSSLERFPTIDLTVVGHRQRVEGPASGERRAIVVLNELVRLGIGEERLSLRDAGDIEPVPGAEEDLNARVTFEPVARSTS